VQIASVVLQCHPAIIYNLGRSIIGDIATQLCT